MRVYSAYEMRWIPAEEYLRMYPWARIYDSYTMSWVPLAEMMRREEEANRAEPNTPDVCHGDSKDKP